jgi:hypothetical protein
MLTRIRVLATMRRHKSAIARVVLPMLATVWFSASASLCFGMTSDATADFSPRPAHHHDSAEHGAPMGHAPDAHRRQTPNHGHGKCPHCPASAAAGEGPSP